jgi:hypothetical protein
MDDTGSYFTELVLTEDPLYIAYATESVTFVGAIRTWIRRLIDVMPNIIDELDTYSIK